MASVMAESEAKHRAAVMHATWGHLDPKPGTTYHGWVLAAFTEYKDVVVLADNFEGVSGGPLLYSEINRLADEMTDAGKVGIYKFTGIYRINKSDKTKNPGKFIGKRTFTPFEKCVGCSESPG